MSSPGFLEPRLVARDSAGVAAGEPVRLAGSRCESCQRVDFPACESCPVCQQPAAPYELPSTARLAGSTSVLHPPPGAQVATPYHVGVAAFPEGIAIMGLLLVESLDALPLGSPVDVVAAEVAGSLTYAFVPE